jgi:hypothetical protein
MQKRINISISEEAIRILDKVKNRSQFIEDLILQRSKPISKPVEDYLIEMVDKIYGRLDTPLPSISVGTPAPSDPFKQFLSDYSKPGVKPPHPEYGYPCCHDGRCKHWDFDEVSGVWINRLTKQTKEFTL